MDFRQTRIALPGRGAKTLAMHHQSASSSSHGPADRRLFDLPEPVARPDLELEPCLAGQPRLQCAQRRQVEFQPFSLDELLPRDHQARVVWNYVERLDLSRLYVMIRAVEGAVGRTPIDPRILLTLWLYATLDGVGSARELDRLCRTELAYLWIRGGVSVNYHTLSDFRTAHPELLDELLTDSVATLRNEGLVSLNRVAEDGMRVRAGAGSDTYRRQETLEQLLAEAQEQVRRLKDELERDPRTMSARQRAARERAARERTERLQRALEQRDKLAAHREARKKGSGPEARASTTDPEATRMKMGDGGTRPAYNVQFATDTEALVITGVIVTNVGSDAGGMSPMVQQHIDRYGKAPEKFMADGGFSTIDDIEAVESQYSITVYTPVKEEDKKRAKGIDPFAPGPKDSLIIGEWRQRMGTDEAQQIYKDRAASAELSNAHVRNRGLRQFLVRGRLKAWMVAMWHAVAHNLKRAVALRAAMRVATG